MTQLSNHLSKFAPEIGRLFTSGRKNPDIIAILITESFFRPSLQLFVELVFFNLCKVAGLRRAQNVSLGRGQIQAKHWNKKITLASVFCLKTAYDNVNAIWSAHGIEEKPLAKKIAFHVGELRTFYFYIAVAAREFVEQLQSRSISK